MPGGKVADDRVFFGSNFSVERLGDLAAMSRPTLGQLYLQSLTFDYGPDKFVLGE